MRVLPVALKAPVESKGEALRVVGHAGDAVVVVRGHPRLLVLRCPCGCGEEVVANVDRKAGPAWRLYSREDNLTVFPSIWRDSGCESHFIVSNGKVYLFDASWEEDEDLAGDYASLRDWVGGAPLDLGLVLAHLRRGEYRPAAEVADELEESPWDVHSACRKLVKKGLAREGNGHRRGCFEAV